MNRIAVILIGCVMFFARPVSATEENAWGTKSAHTIRKGRLEAGLLSPWRWGLTDRIELAANPQSFFLLPSISLKDNFSRHGPWAFGSKHRFAIPSPLLHALAREGSGGLLPHDADIPFILQTEHQLLATAQLGDHWFTVRGGIGLGFASGSELPLVEFPFLYSELAPLYSPLVGRFGWVAEGLVHGPLDYQLVHRLNSWRPKAEIPWPGGNPPRILSQEFIARLRWRIAKRHRLSFGLAASVAEYPARTWFFWTPTFDYRFAIVP